MPVGISTVVTTHSHLSRPLRNRHTLLVSRKVRAAKTLSRQPSVRHPRCCRLPPARLHRQRERVTMRSRINQTNALDKKLEAKHSATAADCQEVLAALSPDRVLDLPGHGSNWLGLDVAGLFYFDMDINPPRSDVIFELVMFVYISGTFLGACILCFFPIFYDLLPL
uniref:Uncharacterized protein n=1 Tax=Oryza nivara TaxID=4536 RepID=A0A0E0HA19_ORYNI